MNKKTQPLLIFSIYITFIFLLYLRQGIIDINEAEKYISAVKQIIKGNVLPTLKNHAFYSSYIIFLYILLPLGGIILVVFVQVILNFIASVFLKKAVNELTGPTKYGTIVQILFLFCYPIQVWTLTLFSDSFFVCIISISSYFILKKEKTMKDLLMLAILTILLIFARPPGIMFALSYFIYYSFQQKMFKPQVHFIVAFLIICLVHLLIFTTKVETTAFIEPVASGAIIVDKPDYNIDEFDHMEKASLADAYHYLLKNNTLGYVSGLYIKKVVSFFTLTRPYYSTGHNLILYFHYLLYPLTILGLFTMFKSQNKNEAMMIIAAIFLCANLTGLTYNEWHYRFTIEIFPLLIISSGYYLMKFSKDKTVNPSID